jgi:glycosyltransferase involved in cell wall biosynthesis
MKLAIVRTFPSVLSSDSYNVQEFGLAKALAKLGVSVDVYTGGESNEEADLYIGPCGRARVIRVPFHQFTVTHAYYPGMLKRVLSGNYDVIQIQGYEDLNTLILSVRGNRQGARTVIHEGLYVSGFGRLVDLFYSVFRCLAGGFVSRNVWGCIGKTQFATDMLVDKGLPNVVTLPIGLDVEKFDEREDIPWRENWGVDGDAWVLGYVGVIEPRRDVKFLIRLLNTLRERGENAYLVIAGTGPERPECEQMARELGVADFVLFIGVAPQRQLPSLYSAMDAFVFASEVEIVGMVLLECLNFGTPVFSSKTAGSMDIIRPEHGRVLDSKSPELWASALCEHLGERDGEGRRRRAGPFTRAWDDLAPLYLDFYTKDA